jgi:hypothetical protein
MTKNTINTDLKQHVTIAGRHLTKIAAQHRSGYLASDSRAYEDACIGCMPSLIVCVLMHGSDEMNVLPAGEPPANLTEREMLFARAILRNSSLDHRTKANLTGQQAVRAAVADFARRLAAIHTSQTAFELDTLGEPA